MTQVPTGALNVTSPLEALTVQPDVEDPSTRYVTGLPEPPPVALTVYVDPTGADVGGVLVKVITWGRGTRLLPVCWACVAAAYVALPA
jgi:hypothetical protein